MEVIEIANLENVGKSWDAAKVFCQTTIREALAKAEHNYEDWSTSESVLMGKLYDYCPVRCYVYVILIDDSWV